MKNIIFTGLTNYHKPYTRVRCYNFSKALNERGMNTKVYSYQEKLFPDLSGEQMLGLSEYSKLSAMFKSFHQIASENHEYLYLQKIHYHAAAPYLLAKLKMKKLILDYDDYDFDRSPMFSNPLLNKIVFGSSDIFRITENIAKTAEKCILSSNYLLKIFREFNEKSFYIPTGVDTDKFKASASKRISLNTADKIIFVWNGMVWGEIMFENVRFLIDCFAEVFKVLKNTELRIAGDGFFMQKLQDYKLSHYSDLPVKFEGYIAPDRMPDFLDNAHIGLLPLLPDKKNYEWFKAKSPTKLFEYLAMGLPSISHNFGETACIIKNGINGLLAENKDDFVEAMLKLAQNSDLYSTISENAVRSAVDNYSQKKITADLFQILNF